MSASPAEAEAARVEARRRTHCCPSIVRGDDALLMTRISLGPTVSLTVPTVMRGGGEYSIVTSLYMKLNQSFLL